MLVRNLKHGAESEAIIRALEETNGTPKKTAEMPSISLRALHYKDQECGIECPGKQARLDC